MNNFHIKKNIVNPYNEGRNGKEMTNRNPRKN